LYIFPDNAPARAGSPDSAQINIQILRKSPGHGRDAWPGDLHLIDVPAHVGLYDATARTAGLNLRQVDTQFKG
jgi:hypothetical protein